MSDLTHTKAGDKVFVVWQQSQYCRTPIRTELVDVERIRAGFGYLAMKQRDVKFSLASGESVHKEISVRINKSGFDVYRNEAEYLKKIEDEKEFQHVARLLCGDKTYALRRLKPKTIQRINGILIEEDDLP